MHPIKKIIGKALPRLQDYVRIRRGYMGSIGGSPKIFRAKTFTEKVQRRKLFERDPRMPERADKILAKTFVRSRLGAGWTTPTLWFGTELPPLSERTWPLPYVIKASHGSGMNMFIREQPDWPDVERLCTKWLGETYGDTCGEWLYSKIQPRLLVEPFIGQLTAVPIDYKFWTFHGRVELIQVNTDRETSVKRTMFDRNWNRLPFNTNAAQPIDIREITRPQSLKLMIESAELLSENMPFVRIDFYEIDSKPRFGEFTYYPDIGWSQFDPPEYDRIVGDLWR